jgi:hypothetical protein
MENLTPWGQGWVRMLRLTSLIRLMIPRSTGKCLAFAAAVEHVEAHGEGTELARKCCESRKTQRVGRPGSDGSQSRNLK